MRELGRGYWYGLSREQRAQMEKANKTIKAAENAQREMRRARDAYESKSGRQSTDEEYWKVLYDEWKAAEAAFSALRGPANEAAKVALDGIMEVCDDYDRTILNKIYESINDSNPFFDLNDAQKYNLAKDMEKYLVIKDEEIEMLLSRNLLSRARYEIVANLGYVSAELGYTDDEDDDDYVYVIKWRLDKAKKPIEPEDIKYLRGNMTQQELAEKANLSLNMIQKLESGERSVARMTAENLRSLVDALHGDIADFI